MKLISFFILPFLFSIFANACPETKNCKIKMNNLRMKMRVISSNMQNVNTTRAPEGGPYQRQNLVCDDKDICQMEKDSSTISKYEPEHPDANKEGYVKYPAINMMREMTDMIEATRDYEEIASTCK